MQKLEEVLRAEEAARHTVNDARDRAAAILAQAELEARQIADTARDETARESRELSDSAQAEAAQRVAAIEAEAQSLLDSTTRTARDRIPQAVQVALDELLS